MKLETLLKQLEFEEEIEQAILHQFSKDKKKIKEISASAYDIKEDTFLLCRAKPLSIILYGSYSNQTNNLNSDFDALVISSKNIQYHDTSFIDNIQLDVFIYPYDYFNQEYNIEDFIQIFDGKIIKDTNNLAKELQVNVLTYLQNQSFKTNEEIQDELDWCTKNAFKNRTQ